MSRLEEILNLVEHIPPFPKVARQVMLMLEDPDVRAGDLAGVIQYDEAITANVLKICNAAYFGLLRKVSSLDEALVMIGHDILKDIIITSSSARFYRGNAGGGYQLDAGELWKHSVATAIMARQLAPYFKGVSHGSAYTAALLHDIGKRILGSFVADDLNRIMGQVLEEKCTFVEAEKDCLGATHAELGGMILAKWEFSPDMIAAVKLHHDPQALRKEPLTAVVALSNALVVSLGIGGGADGLASELHGEELKRLGIARDGMDLMMASLVSEMARAQELLQL